MVLSLHLLVFFFAIATVSCSTENIVTLVHLRMCTDGDVSIQGQDDCFNIPEDMDYEVVIDQIRFIHDHSNNMSLFVTSVRLIEDEMRDRVLVYNDTIVHVFILIDLDLSDVEVPFNFSCKRAGDVWFHVFDYVMKRTLNPDLKTIPHLPGDTTVKHNITIISLRLKERRARMKKLVHGTIEGVKRYLVKNYQLNDTQASTEIINSVLESENYDELLRLLNRNLDSINITIETCADVVTESYQILPREVVELIAKLTLTQLQQQAVQQQIEKIERLQQIMGEEGVPTTLRGSKREAEDEKYGKIRLLLTLFLAWFLLCYCSEGTVPWCVDVDLTFGLSLALSEIVLLLGGDIEKNPGPLTGDELAKIDARCLSAEKDLGVVYRAIYPLAHSWRVLCILLGIPMSEIDTTEQTYRGRGDDCLSKGLYEWLKRKYDTDQYGLPSWRTLIKYIDKIDCALAGDLAKKHKVDDTAPLREDDHCCECRESVRSGEFSDLFRKVSTYLRTDIRGKKVNKLQKFLRYFYHKGQRIKYRGATSKDILDALFDDKYITPTNFHLLNRIVERFGGRKCKKRLIKYNKKHPTCTCNL